MDQVAKHSDEPLGGPETPVVGKPRLPYQKPQILTFGDIRDVTLGMTPGIGDNGNPALFRP